MQFSVLASSALITIFSTVGLASPVADPLPWANANPQAAAAAHAFAEAHAEAVAIGHPDPKGYALAASADDCASVECHMHCGMMIVYGENCSQNQENHYAGPYDQDCLCSTGSDFMSEYAACMDCGWTLWKYYSPYLTSALEACSTLSTEPTGTSRCSTTLSSSYSFDPSIQPTTTYSV